MSKKPFWSAILALLLTIVAPGLAGPSIATATAICTPAAGNLIANPGMETPGTPASAPAGWTFNNWGTTASGAYLASGFGSTRSVKSTVTAIAGGDAKWAPAAVCVQGITAFAYTDQYLANVPTHIVYDAFNASGVETFNDVALNIPATAVGATVPKTFTGSFIVPAGTIKLSVLHLIEKAGTLQIDNVSLRSDQPAITNLVPNFSVETPDSANASLPQAWAPSSWGTNTHTFKYVAGDGAQGTRSVQACITSYGTNPATAGDAKWTFAGQPLTKGADYRATFQYKTNNVHAVHVVGHYILPNGTEEFFGMPDPEPAGDSATGWTTYSDVFGVPANAVSSDVFMFIAGVGCVSVDNFSLAPYKYTGFDKARVSLTFDDDLTINYANARPVLNQYGFKPTFYLPIKTGTDPSGWIEGNPAQEALVKQIAADGYEIGAHTITHPHLPSLPCPGTQLSNELAHTQAYLRTLTGQSVTDFASPYGEYTECVNTQIAKYYISHRTTDEGFNSKDNLNPYRLRVQNMTPATTLAQFQGWVKKAEADHTWLILIYHNVDDKTNPAQAPDPFDTYLQDFKPQMAWLAGESTAGRTSVQPVNAALAAVRAQ